MTNIANIGDYNEKILPERRPFENVSTTARVDKIEIGVDTDNSGSCAMLSEIACKRTTIPMKQKRRRTSFGIHIESYSHYCIKEIFLAVSINNSLLFVQYEITYYCR